MRKAILALSVVLLTTACATRPGNIKPAEVDSAVYSSQACSALEAEHTTAKATLAEFESKQTRRANMEIASVVMFGIFGAVANAVISDNEGNVAEWKGKVKAIEDAKKAQGCVAPEPAAS